MVRVPELDGHIGASGAVNCSTVTQARHAGEVDQMAREFIATVTGLPVEDVHLRRRDVGA